MEKNFNCPVCGAKCVNLTALKNCIAEHEKAEKDNEEKQKEQKIKCLEAENKKLFEMIRKNCEELKKFGVDAKVTYNTMGTRGQKDNWKTFREATKINSDELEGSLETFLKTMLGGY